MSSDTLLDSFLTELSNLNLDNQLDSHLRQTCDHYRRLKPIAPKYDFRDVPYNGLRSFLTMTEGYLEKLGSELNYSHTDRNYVKRVTNVSKMFNTGFELIENFTGVSEKKMSYEEVALKMMSITREQFQSIVEFQHFWLDRGTRVKFSSLGNAVVTRFAR